MIHLLDSHNKKTKGDTGGFFETTGRTNVLLDIEVGILLAKKELNPSLRTFGLYFYIILSVDCHGY